MDQEKIGKFIKDIRLKENLSQQIFAQKYNVTYQAVSKWENGKSIPDIAILKQMCSDYDMNLDDFLEAKISKSKNEKR
ncbi:MAG: helix-turn-helix transcriptional regulator, partial [Bacilli bacterium]|nr:helix-turn-helix transcriptional regulator [Bacilli bacterium]